MDVPLCSRNLPDIETRIWYVSWLNPSSFNPTECLWSWRLKGLEFWINISNKIHEDFPKKSALNCLYIFICSLVTELCERSIQVFWKTCGSEIFWNISRKKLWWSPFLNVKDLFTFYEDICKGDFYLLWSFCVIVS